MATERERIDDMLDAIVWNAEAVRGVLDSCLLVPKPEPVPDDAITVAVGESVQAAYDSLLSTGGVIKLAPGIHRGDLRLAARPPEAKLIVITSDSENLPDANTRIGPEYVEALGVLQGVSKSLPPVRILNQARNVAFVCVGVAPPVTKSYPHIDMGGDEHGMLTPADRPDGFLFDRCFLYGDPVLGAHRGLSANASNVTLRNSYIKDIFEIGRDSQAVGAWNGCQNLVVDNCYLEGGAENVMFGGADSASPEMVCQDLVITNCHLAKVYNDAWKLASIKTLFEIKSAKRVRMSRCLLEKNWKRDWATGVALTLKACNQSGSETWATCEDVTLSNLVIRNVGSCFGVIGKNDGANPSDWMRRVKLENILVFNINVAPWLGTGRGFSIANGAEEALVADHITMHTNGHSWMDFRTDSGIVKSPGALKVTNSMLAESSYGYFSQANGIGMAAMQKDWNGTVLSGNVFKMGSRGQGTLPPDNLRLSAAAWDASLGPDHLVLPGSPAAAVKTTDGELPGAILAAPPSVLPTTYGV